MQKLSLYGALTGTVLALAFAIPQADAAIVVTQSTIVGSTQNMLFGGLPNLSAPPYTEDGIKASYNGTFGASPNDISSTFLGTSNRSWGVVFGTGDTAFTEADGSDFNAFGVSVGEDNTANQNITFNLNGQVITDHGTVTFDFTGITFESLKDFTVLATDGWKIKEVDLGVNPSDVTTYQTAGLDRTLLDNVRIDNSALDLGNPVAVPEPSSWALMILGFGALGALLRRQRLIPRLV